MTPIEQQQRTYEQYKTAIRQQPLPCAIVDLAALRHNISIVKNAAQSTGKTIRVASKSVRSVALLQRIANELGTTFGGLMTYSAAETARLAEHGFNDLLLAYPTAQSHELQLLAKVGAQGKTVSVIVDCVEHLQLCAQAASAENTTINVVIDMDMSLELAQGRVHLGVRRSPNNTVASVVMLAQQIAQYPSLRFYGVMGYEAQIAGLTDNNPFISWRNYINRAFKHVSKSDVAQRRQTLVETLTQAGLRPTIFNGGGTGSLYWSLRESALTEVTVGSGFLASHLFDYYQDWHAQSAAYFAVQVVRKPAPGWITCHGGGLIASGVPNSDRAPQPCLPPGLQLSPDEGAGEVQTPLRVSAHSHLNLGDPVFFRHAKAGELAEHFTHYLLIENEQIVDQALTYRGQHWNFL